MLQKTFLRLDIFQRKIVVAILILKNIRNRKNAVINYIKSLECDSAHYCRGSSSISKYLSAELSINKLFNMYNKSFAELRERLSKMFSEK